MTVADNVYYHNIERIANALEQIAKNTSLSNAAALLNTVVNKDQVFKMTKDQEYAEASLRG